MKAEEYTADTDVMAGYERARQLLDEVPGEFQYKVLTMALLMSLVEDQRRKCSTSEKQILDLWRKKDPIKFWEAVAKEAAASAKHGSLLLAVLDTINTLESKMK